MCDGLLWILCGVFIALSVWYRWSPWVEHWKVRSTFRLLGDRWATVFYVAMGILFAIIGYLMCVDAVKLR